MNLGQIHWKNYKQPISCYRKSSGGGELVAISLKTVWWKDTTEHDDEVFWVDLNSY